MKNRFGPLKAFRRRPAERPSTDFKAALAFGLMAAVLLLPLPSFAASSDKASLSPVSDMKPTFTKDVAPILQQRCQDCHHEEGAGRMRLMTYQEAKAYAPTIKYVTGKRTMPPWHAEEGDETFHESRRLSDREIAILAKWADDGAPQGDEKDMPPPRVFPPMKEWTLGEPEMIGQSPQTYDVPAEGSDVYRNFVIPTNYGEDRYIQGIEIKPDNLAVVHHVLLFIDRKGQSVAFDKRDPGPGYTSSGGGIGFQPDGLIDGWAPGNNTGMIPDGVAFLLPKNAYIVMQVHYHLSGKPEKDRTKFGLIFSKKPVNKLVYISATDNHDFSIPAGAKDYKVVSEWTAPEDIIAVAIAPHMHQVGKRMKVYARMKDGKTVPLINISHWDFNWQTSYSYKNPIFLPAGTKVISEGFYDNSADNPTNPNSPPKVVTWGEQTTDEMCMAFVAYLKNNENLLQDKKATEKAASAR